MLPTGFCHVWAVIHNKHCFMRFRKNLHFVLTFVPGPAVNERRLREKADEGGWGVGAQSVWYNPQKTDCPAHLPTLRLLKRRGARMRVQAQERTRTRACARRSRTAPPSSLLRGWGLREPAEGSLARLVAQRLRVAEVLVRPGWGRDEWVSRTSRRCVSRTVRPLAEQAQRGRGDHSVGTPPRGWSSPQGD